MENSSAESLSSSDVTAVASEALKAEIQEPSTVEVQVSSSSSKNGANPYNALSDSLKEGVGGGSKKIRFFGPRFMTIWVMPIAVTGIIMEFLFVGPLRNANPFN